MGINLINNYSVSHGAKNKSNKKLITTQNGETYQKAGAWRTIGAVTAGALVGNGIVRKSIQNLANLPLRHIFSNNFEVPADAYDKLLEASKLKQTGLKIIDLDKMDFDGLDELVEKASKNWINKIPAASKLQKFIIHSQLTMAKNGLNAFYIYPTNQIALSKTGKVQFAIFHELGHVLNKHRGVLTKILQKSRTPFTMLSTAAGLTALFKRKKVEGEKPQGTFDKATTFVKNNCGKLAFLGMVPVLLEEGLASLRGQKLAKNILSAEKLKELKNLNLRAFSTYAGMAVGVGIGATIASFIRDKIAAPKKV